MQVTEGLIEEIGRRINTEKSKKENTYVPPYDIKKSVEAFLNWLNENGYEIKKTKE